jgi:predicted phosphodiesterase
LHRKEVFLHFLCKLYKEKLRFRIEDCEVVMKHIGGYPGRYDASIREEIYSQPPQLFISGHSHILKVIYDKKIDCLHINPGAAGKQGWQQQRTLIKVTIDGRTFKDLEIVELK